MCINNPRYIDVVPATPHFHDETVLQADPGNHIMAKLPTICYDVENSLHIELIIPERHEDYIPKYEPDGSFYDIPYPTEPDGSRSYRFPVVIYVQGSGWLKQNLGFRIPMLSRIVDQGYAMAFVEYQSVEEAPFPAQLDNVRDAVKFLRAHSCEYNLDMDRSVLWGDSSGAHIAVMLAVQEAQKQQPNCSFRGIIDFYGPAVIDRLDPALAKTLLQSDSDEDFAERALAVSPTAYIQPGICYPPFLIVHGDCDRLVSYEQSELLHHRLKECGADADLYRVHGGDHGRGEFWCGAVFDTVLKYLRKWIY